MPTLWQKLYSPVPSRPTGTLASSNEWHLVALILAVCGLSTLYTQKAASSTTAYDDVYGSRYVDQALQALQAGRYVGVDRGSSSFVHDESSPGTCKSPHLILSEPFYFCTGTAVSRGVRMACEEHIRRCRIDETYTLVPRLQLSCYPLPFSLGKNCDSCVALSFRASYPIYHIPIPRRRIWKSLPLNLLWRRKIDADYGPYCTPRMRFLNKAEVIAVWRLSQTLWYAVSRMALRVLMSLLEVFAPSYRRIWMTKT